MFESFYVAFSVVFPMIVLMAIGWIIRVGGVITRENMKRFDTVIFKLFMPVLLFKNIYEIEDISSLNIKVVVLVLIGLFVLFGIALTVPKQVESDHNKAASMGQALVRTNYILFGIAVAESIYGTGNAGIVALMGVIVIPCTNAFGVIILERNRSGNVGWKKLLCSIMKNPMIIAAILALVFRALPFAIPDMLYGVVEDIAGVTTPVSFISLGVGLDLGAARQNIRTIGTYVGIRMILTPIIMLSLCLLLGFRGPELCVMMVIFAAPTAVASYPMAVAMGADGPLAGQLVCVSTLISVFTIFLATFMFQSMGLL